MIISFLFFFIYLLVLPLYLLSVIESKWLCLNMRDKNRDAGILKV